MNICFRTSAGSKNGWGNLYRLLIIFYMLKSKLNFQYIFLINGNFAVKKFLESKKINFKLIKSQVILMNNILVKNSMTYLL